MRLSPSLTAGLCAGALVANALAAPAQEAKPSIYDARTLAALPSIVAAAQKSTTAYDVVEHLSDTIGPRLSGSPQAAAAVEYVAAQFRSMGLRVRLQPVMVPHWVRGEESAELVDWPGRPGQFTQKVILTALGPSAATPPEGLTADVAVVHDDAELAKLGTSVRGKIVLFETKFNEVLANAGGGLDAYGAAVRYRFAGPLQASQLGAAAALVRSVGGADFRLPHTGATFFPKGVTPIAAAAVSAEDADQIDRLAKGGTVRMHLTLRPQLLPDVQSANVIGDLPGSTNPEQVVVVSGHLDSWDLGRGAIDDGAGFSQAIGAVSVLTSLGLRPRRTIRCIAWMSEEEGGIGGREYARDEAANAASHVALIESDLGADHPLGVGTTLGRSVKPWLDPVSEALTPQGSPVQRLEEDSETDIGPMSNLGVPAFSVLQDARHYFDYHHTAADTLDKIDPVQLAQNTAVMATLAFALADALQPPPRGAIAPAR